MGRDSPSARKKKKKKMSLKNSCYLKEIKKKAKKVIFAFQVIAVIKKCYGLVNSSPDEDIEGPELYRRLKSDKRIQTDLSETKVTTNFLTFIIP